MDPPANGKAGLLFGLRLMLLPPEVPSVQVTPVRLTAKLPALVPTVAGLVSGVEPYSLTAKV